MEAILYRPIDSNKDYWIGTNGTLYSFKTYHGHPVAAITWQYHDRYVCATIRIGGIPKRVYQHRLLAIAFIENPLNKEEVNHIDYNRFNNNLSNLEWATPSENASHSMSREILRYEKRKRSVISNQALIEIIKMKKSGLTCKQIENITGFKRRTIHAALTSKRAAILS